MKNCLYGSGPGFINQSVSIFPPKTLIIFSMTVKIHHAIGTTLLLTLN